MTDDSPDRSGHRALTAFASSQTLLSLVCLTISLLRPSDTGKAVLLGQSVQRLLVSVLLLAALGGSAMLALRLRNMTFGSAAIQRFRGGLHLPALGSALLLILLGAALLIPNALGAAGAINAYLDGILPLAVWLFLTGCALAMAVLRISGAGRRRGETVAFSLLVAICLLGMVTQVRLWPPSEDRGDDIYFTFLEGDRLLHGENPYVRVLAGDMRENEKYATYLPLFYYLSAGAQLLGFGEFPPWAALWRIAFLVAGCWVAVCIFERAWRSGFMLFGVAGSLFWLLNRWTLHVTISADLDFLPLALLLMAWALLPKRPRAALILFGTSIAIKHYAIFLTPLFLAQLWRDSTDPESRRWSDLLLLGSVPLIVSLPFLLLGPEALMKSTLFSISRNPMASGNVASLDALLGWSGWAARLPMLGLILLIYTAVWRGRLGPYASSLLIMATVTFFNSVFFTSYMVWVMPFIPLAVVEAFPRFAPSRDPGPSPA